MAMLVLATLLAGCNLGRGALAYLQSTADFTQCTTDPRILCEPGSEAFARRLVPLMPAATATVEQAQYGRFVAPIRVLTYASTASFARHAAVGQHALGATALGKVHLSSRLADMPGLQQKILTHELAHLHLFQQAGNAVMRWPNWFMEGLSTVVSHGGGADPVTRQQAVFALVHGVHFEAEAEGSLFFPRRASAFKLSWPMYYRQTSLMVDYMRQRDAGAFERLIRALAAGKPFAGAVRAAYGYPLDVLWQNFRKDLGKDPDAVWPR